MNYALPLFQHDEPAAYPTGGWFGAIGRMLRRLSRETPRAAAPATVAPCNRPAPACTTSGPAVFRTARAIRSPNLPLPRKPATPLRVVRVLEAGQAPAMAGRILMSGSMADVCAELDRMVARETALQSGA